MHVLPELDLMEGVLADHLPHLRPAQRRGLALWLAPEPWPQPPPDLVVHIHAPAKP